MDMLLPDWRRDTPVRQTHPGCGILLPVLFVFERLDLDVWRVSVLYFFFLIVLFAQVATAADISLPFSRATCKHGLRGRAKANGDDSM